MEDELRKLLASATANPWEYRPYEHDDWGYIRGPEVEWSIGPVKPVVAISREGDTESDHNAHRRNKTDPYEPNGRLIVAAVNALPALLDRIAELETALRRIKEGDEDRPVGTRFRQDGKSSKHDKCVHDIWMYETCGECISALARSALTLSGADGEGPRG